VALSLKGFYPDEGAPGPSVGFDIVIETGATCRVMECLNRLGYDIEIKLTPAAESVGRRSLAVV